MATKTKKKEVAITIAPEANAPRLKKDGTPWAPSVKRPHSEILKDHIERRAKMVAAHEKALAKVDKLIAHFSTAGVSGEEAVSELLADGYSPAEIEALEAKLRKAKAALKGKTPEEIEALRAAAVKPEVPDFLADEDEENDDE